MSTLQYGTVHEALRETVPEFGPTIDEHLAEDGEVLQHVLFGDLVRFVADAHDRGHDELVTRCLEFADRALRTGDAKVKNLVQVSFVEDFQPFGNRWLAFIETWPPSLRTEAYRQRDWRPGETDPASAG